MSVTWGGHSQICSICRETLAIGALTDAYGASHLVCVQALEVTQQLQSYLDKEIDLIDNLVRHVMEDTCS